MDTNPSVQAELAVFTAVELRDEASLARVRQLDAWFCWPPSLPCGRNTHGLNGGIRGSWHDCWNPLQPRTAQWRLDPRVMGGADDEVVVLSRPRGLALAGDGLDGEVLGLDGFRDGKLAGGQIGCLGPASVGALLARASRMLARRAGPRPGQRADGANQ